MGWRPTFYNTALVTWLVVLTLILAAVIGPMARAQAAHSGGASHPAPAPSHVTPPAAPAAHLPGVAQSKPLATPPNNNGGLLEPSQLGGDNGFGQTAHNDDNPWWGILPVIFFVGAAYFVIKRVKRSKQRYSKPDSSPGNDSEVPPIDDRPPEPKLVATLGDRVADVPAWGRSGLAADRPVVTPVRGIFLSYRRDDAEGQAGRLYGDLAQAFGEGFVFMDVAGIGAGLDFRKVIDKHVTSCAVLLALIGPEWLDAKDSTGSRRLDDPTDFVRLETAAALRRDIPVVPILVRGARMPRPEQLPEDLKDLAYRNGAELTHARWSSDVEILVKELKQLMTR